MGCASMVAMGLSRKLLGEGEEIVLHLRTHAKKLVLPALVLIVLGALVGVAIALLPPSTEPWGRLVVAGVAVVLAIVLVLVPYLRWRTTTYTVTNRRIITRTGIVNQTGHDLPLVRINDVSYERSLTDRMLGCGTLNIRTASEQGPVVLPDVPGVERVHVEITELLFDSTNPSYRHDVHDDEDEAEDDES